MLMMQLNSNMKELEEIAKSTEETAAKASHYFLRTSYIFTRLFSALMNVTKPLLIVFKSQNNRLYSNP